LIVLKILTVYFTRSGNTEKVVKKIHESVEGDLELLKESISRKGVVGWLKTGGSNAKREVTEINDTQYDPSEYDLVILASPIWAGTISSPMRSYVMKNRDKLDRTAIFLTNDSGAVEAAFLEIYELLNTKPLVERSLQRSKMKNEFESTVTSFVDSIQALD
jgi:flavodoxin